MPYCGRSARNGVERLARVAAERERVHLAPRPEERRRIDLPRAVRFRQRVVEAAGEAQNHRQLRVRDRTQRIALDHRAHLGNRLVEGASRVAQVERGAIHTCFGIARIDLERAVPCVGRTIRIEVDARGDEGTCRVRGNERRVMLERSRRRPLRTRGHTVGR